MPNQELEEILDSLQEIVRKAYALGRGDALKHVIEVMQAEETRKPLAITGPVAPVAASDPVPDVAVPAGQEMQVYASTSDAPDAAGDQDGKPWWARAKRSVPVRPVRELRAVR